MILIQYDDATQHLSTVLVIIEPGNLDRMKQSDPISLMPAKVGGFLKPTTYPSMRLLIAYEHETGKLYEMVNAGASPLDLVAYVERGYKFTDADGKRFDVRRHNDA